MHNKLIFVFLLISACNFAQIDGYWDKERATSKQVVVSARDRIVIPLDPLPEGTTEIVYRITLLDENQQLSSSLISILKAIPDPTGISQGSAGAIFLLSKIAGNDACKYAIFTTKEKALAYVKDGISEKACLYQNKPINKDARRITLDETTCFQNNAMWFGFESKNWILNQKIILEVVPWVDTKLSRGWNVAHKKEIINVIDNLPIYKTLTKKEEFAACYLESVTGKYSYKEYKKLLGIEWKKDSDAMVEACVLQTGETAKLSSLIRDRAAAAFNGGQQEMAIKIIREEIIEANKGVAMDYSVLGDYYLLTKQFAKAEEAYVKGLAIDSNEINLKLDLAQLYLFTNRLAEAKEINKTYKSYNVSTSTSWKQQVEIDFATFKKYGLPTKNFKKILRLLE